MGSHVKEKWVRNLEDCEKRPTFAVAFEEGAAQVAELVDALVSGTSNSNVVQVRFLSWARFLSVEGAAQSGCRGCHFGGGCFGAMPRWWNW